jgi:hypothetical protein
MLSSGISGFPNLITFSSSCGPNELDGVGTSDNDDVDLCLILCESDLDPELGAVGGESSGQDLLRLFEDLPSVSLCDDWRVAVAPFLLSAAVDVFGAA